MKLIFSFLGSLLITLMPPKYTCRIEGDYKPETGVDIGEVSSGDLEAVTTKLRNAREKHLAAIHLTVDSPGGDVGAMIALASEMHRAQAEGMFISCEVVPGGMAASAGFVLLQQCDYRKAGKGSIMLGHEPSAGVMFMVGKPGEWQRLADHLRSLSHALAGMTVGKFKISLQEYEKRTLDKDYWLSCSEALEIGAIDECQGQN